MINARIYKKKLFIEGGVVSDSVRFEKIKFSFPEEWNGYEKTVVFSNDATTISVVFIEGNSLYLGDNECYIPHEVNKSPGFYVSVFGIKGDSRATASRVFVDVLESGYELGEVPSDPTPSEYEQLIQLSQQTHDIAQSVRDDADNGMFRGEKGEKGEDGTVSFNDLTDAQRESLKGEAGVYYGIEEPTDSSHPVWVSPIAAENPIIDMVYPVGSVYISKNSTNPQELFGGEWLQIKDRFILAAGDTYSVGDIGGEAKHTLSVFEIPNGFWNVGFGGEGGIATSFDVGSYYGIFSGQNNIGQPHNNMPPYTVYYMWERIN